ncbi:CCA tRNA nucleotidyltransferase [Garciella nitratireducens]|uniref:CCA tRNA nucleotidyltransferase n=1 Tax=Garciella nitratireducens TaxID=218205 RepID=UPI001BD635CD|nr:hypothetical protein [Garciella nitratireducens]
MNENILEKLPNKVKKEVIRLNSIAKEKGYFSYFIGGLVRDWVLKKPIKDIDMVIQGDALEIAKIYGEKYNISVQYFPRFQTAKIPLDDRIFNNIDLISTRKEIYEFPGALPKIIEGNLKDDLYRRDFSINTLCYSLNSFKIIDLFQGEKDIKNKLIRVLYSKSFMDDPTRILRAIRFKNRFEFKYEAYTKEYMIEAINKKAFATISSDRIKKELILCLQEEKVKEILMDFIEFNIIETLFFIKDISENQFIWLEKVCKIIKNKNKVLVILLIVFFNANQESIEKFCDFYQINKDYKKLLISNKEVFLKIKNELKKNNLTPFEIYRLFSSLKEEQIIFLNIYLQEKFFIKKFLEYYVNELRDVHIFITGKDLISLGIPPGPIYDVIFKRVLKNKINLGWKTKEKEIEYIKKHIKEWRE